MKNHKIFLYIACALAFMMCGSLWNEFVASDKSVNPNIRNSVNPSFRNSVNPSIRNSVNPKIRNSYYAVPQASVESFPFDPNEADSSQLLRLGLTPAQVRSIYRHRAKGYVYSTPEDFARTPFMTKGQWAHLKPLINIGDQYRLLNVTDNRSSLTDNRSPLSAPTADSSAAVSRSVRSENPDTSFTFHLSPVNLNESSFKALVRHPFLSYEQVKAVKNFQRKYGRIRNMTELLILPEFTVEDTLRLSPYLQF